MIGVSIMLRLRPPREQQSAASAQQYAAASQQGAQFSGYPR
jgi:hypothetical protein